VARVAPEPQIAAGDQIRLMLQPPGYILRSGQRDRHRTQARMARAFLSGPRRPRFNTTTSAGSRYSGVFGRRASLVSPFETALVHLLFDVEIFFTELIGGLAALADMDVQLPLWPPVTRYPAASPLFKDRLLARCRTASFSWQRCAKEHAALHRSLAS
jgi:hypothetical protein